MERTRRIAAKVLTLGIIALQSALFVATDAAALTEEELCIRRLDRMLAAQTSRLIKELHKCARRKSYAIEFAELCVPRATEHGDLVATEKRMSSGLTRVERHGDDKFPRKCSGMPSDFFEPACSDITDASRQLRRCVYADHSLPFLVDLVETTRDLSPRCRRASLKQARIAWRDWLAEDNDATFSNRLTALKRSCGGNIAHWSTIVDSIRARSRKLRLIVE